MKSRDSKKGKLSKPNVLALFVARTTWLSTTVTSFYFLSSFSFNPVGVCRVSALCSSPLHSLRVGVERHCEFMGFQVEIAFSLLATQHLAEGLATRL